MDSSTNGHSHRGDVAWYLREVQKRWQAILHTIPPEVRTDAQIMFLIGAQTFSDAVADILVSLDAEEIPAGVRDVLLEVPERLGELLAER